MAVKQKAIKSDLERIDKLDDKNIDYSDIPELGEGFFKQAVVDEMPVSKDSITLRVDHAVLEWFKQQGKGYQTRINAVLKAYYKAHHSD